MYPTVYNEWVAGEIILVRSRCHHLVKSLFHNRKSSGNECHLFLQVHTSFGIKTSKKIKKGEFVLEYGGQLSLKKKDTIII